MRVKSSWVYFAVAGIPCAVLLFFCVVALREWWLISSGQIAVIPTPMPGQSSVPEVPAANLLPLIFGSGILALLFAYAWLRRSRPVLVCAYFVVLLLIAVPYVAGMSSLIIGLIVIYAVFFALVNIIVTWRAR